MTYRLRTSRKKRSSYTVPLIVSGVALALIVLLQFFSPRLLSGPVTIVSKPFIFGRNAAAASLSGIGAYFTSRDALEKQIQDLTQTQESEAYALANLKSLQNENDQLRAMLGRVPKQGSVVMASILSKPPVSPYDTYLVDAGLAEGSKLNTTVLSEGGLPIGTVTEVNSHTSLVRLYSNAGNAIQVDLGTSTTAVEADGLGGGGFQIKVPQTAGISVGDPIFMPPNFSEQFSAVSAVDKSPTDSYETIYFSLPIQIDNEKWVLINK